MLPVRDSGRRDEQKVSKLLAFPSTLSLLAALLVSINIVGQELETGGTLRSAAQAHGFLVGASAELKPLGTDPAYAQTLAREYNVLTAENAMKFEALRATRAIRFCRCGQDRASTHGTGSMRRSMTRAGYGKHSGRTCSGAIISRRSLGPLGYHGDGQVTHRLLKCRWPRVSPSTNTMKAAELVWMAAHDLESRRWPDGVAPCNVKLLLPPRQSSAQW
jgi:hypothetical protein